MGSAQLFVRRKFERVEFRAAERLVYAPPLAVAVSLPGLVAGDPSVWQSAREGLTATHWLRAIDGSRAAPSAAVPFVRSKSSIGSLRPASRMTPTRPRPRERSRRRAAARGRGVRDQQRARLLGFARAAFTGRSLNKSWSCNRRGCESPLPKDGGIWFATRGRRAAARVSRSCGEQSRRSNSLRTRGPFAYLRGLGARGSAEAGARAGSRR